MQKQFLFKTHLVQHPIQKLKKQSSYFRISRLCSLRPVCIPGLGECKNNSFSKHTCCNTHHWVRNRSRPILHLFLELETWTSRFDKIPLPAQPGASMKQSRVAFPLPRTCPLPAMLVTLSRIARLQGNLPCWPSSECVSSPITRPVVQPPEKT